MDMINCLQNHNHLLVLYEPFDKYQIVQNRDAFGFIDEMSDDIKFEKIGETQTGMIYLIEQLKNTVDNYKTLNLFLEQSGLSPKALILLGF